MTMTSSYLLSSLAIAALTLAWMITLGHVSDEHIMTRYSPPPVEAGHKQARATFSPKLGLLSRKRSELQHERFLQEPYDPFIGLVQEPEPQVSKEESTPAKKMNLKSTKGKTEKMNMNDSKSGKAMSVSMSTIMSVSMSMSMDNSSKSHKENSKALKVKSPSRPDDAIMSMRTPNSSKSDKGSSKALKVKSLSSPPGADGGAGNKVFSDEAYDPFLGLVQELEPQVSKEKSTPAKKMMSTSTKSKTEKMSMNDGKSGKMSMNNGKSGKAMSVSMSMGNNSKSEKGNLSQSMPLDAVDDVGKTSEPV